MDTSIPTTREGSKLIPRATEEGDKTVQNEEDTIQLVAQESPSFQIKTDMF
jgi:hypothetical protein